MGRLRGGKVQPGANVMAVRPNGVGAAAGPVGEIVANKLDTKYTFVVSFATGLMLPSALFARARAGIE